MLDFMVDFLEGGLIITAFIFFIVVLIVLPVVFVFSYLI